MSGAAEAAGAPRPWERYDARDRATFLFVLFLAGISNYLDRNVISVLLEPIKAEFGASDTMLGLLTGLAFALFYAGLGLPIARLADRGDRRIIITASLVVSSVMTLLCGMAQSFWQLAAARVGVGAGEAGTMPPAQSLLADYFAPDRRARALGIFLMSATAGYVLGLMGGGWIAEHHGWRAAFVAAALPGLLLALATQLLLDEPRRTMLAARSPLASASQEAVRATFAALMRKPSYRGIVLALILYFLMAYGALVFTPSFMIRVHGLSVAEAGALFGIVSATGAVVGNLLGGALADRLAARDVAWLARLPGCALLLAYPLYAAAFLAPAPWAMTVLLTVASTIVTGAVPAVFAALHIVCGSARRAMAVALAFFFANLVGLGLGPVLAGGLSDLLAARHGAADGLRYALVIVMVTFVPAGWLLLRAGGHLAADAED